MNAEMYVATVIGVVAIVWRLVDFRRNVELDKARAALAQLKVCEQCPLNVTPLAQANHKRSVDAQTTSAK